MSSDTEYFRQRATVERALAEKAANPEATAVHEALAQKYAALADRLEVGGAASVTGRREKQTPSV